MRHASDGVLRRLQDEPFAVPDSVFEHVRRCRRCTTRRGLLAETAGLAARLLSVPQPVPDVDRAWEDLQGRLDRGPTGPAGRRVKVHAPARRPRVVRIPLRTAVAAGAVALAVTGSAAAAATLTDVFAPTRVAPVAVTPADFRAVASLLSFSDTGAPAGFPTVDGTGSLPFGTLRWQSSGPATQASSLAQLEAMTGLPVALPARVPAGVGIPVRYVAQPRVTVTMEFTSGRLAGSSVTLTVGPAVFVGYESGAGQAEVPTLGILALPRPTALSHGASIAQIETFLLSQPGIPSNLAEEIRLLGSPSGVLPVPAPTGMETKSMQIGKWPGVLITDPSKVAAATVWEDGAGTVHAVAGLLDQKGVLDVARQLS